MKEAAAYIDKNRGGAVADDSDEDENKKYD